MTTISKAFVGAIAAGAMAVVPAVPAAARDRDDGGIGVGEIIAGAVILGGIAAVAGSIGNNNRSDSRYYRNGRSGYYNGNPRSAVEQCVNAVRSDAGRRGFRYAQVTQIRDVDDTRNGWKVKGDILVQANQRGGYYAANGRGSNRNYNGRYDARRGDDGRFTCYIDRGRVSRVDYSGVRGL